ASRQRGNVEGDLVALGGRIQALLRRHDLGTRDHGPKNNDRPTWTFVLGGPGHLNGQRIDAVRLHHRIVAKLERFFLLVGGTFWFALGSSDLAGCWFARRRR